MLAAIKKDFEALKDPKRAKLSQRYFKTGKGEYGEGDVFVGLTVPQTRTLVKKYKDMSLADITQLLHSPIHEYRLAAVLLLVQQFERGDATLREGIYKLYLRSTKYINNWDLVDSSAPQIVGGYLADKKDRSVLDEMANSNNLWKQRIAMLATLQFIKHDDFRDTFRIAETLLYHEHDLIHKAVGWMLREVGNRDREAEERFLKQHYKTMPRTALRYAIEKFPERARKAYLQGKI